MCVCVCVCVCVRTRVCFLISSFHYSSLSSSQSDITDFPNSFSPYLPIIIATGKFSRLHHYNFVNNNIRLFSRRKPFFDYGKQAVDYYLKRNFFEEVASL